MNLNELGHRPPSFTFLACFRQEREREENVKKRDRGHIKKISIQYWVKKGYKIGLREQKKYVIFSKKFKEIYKLNPKE